MQKKKILICLFALFFLTISCAKEKGMKGVDLRIELKPSTITDQLFVSMNYEFKLDADFQKITKDYKIFTHLWRPSTKEMLLVDDHMPIKKTSEWQTGDVINYSRTFFIPQFLNEFDIDFEGYEEIRLTVGLYNPDPQARSDSFLLFEKKINIEPASVNAPEIVYSDGWEEMETNMQSNDPFSKNWRWTNRSAICIIDNHKKLSTLILRGGVNKTLLSDQKIIVKINDQVVDEFIPELNVFYKEYSISPAMMGNGDEFTLKIETDKVFVPAKLDPANKDSRELGIQMFFLYFREKPQ